MSPVSLRASGLEKRFGAVAALRGVDLEAPAGSALAVLGPNGAGKTTLLRVLAGLARPTAGSVEIRGDGGAGRHRGAARAVVGFVGHATLLYPELTARENLVFSARLHGVASPAERADALLAEEGLEALAGRSAAALSRGLAQRLAIARALVHDPPLILLDEPFTGLDRPAADRLGARLRRLRDGGRTLVLVTHDLRQAAEIADAALFLLGGRVVRGAEGAELAADRLERDYAALLEPGRGTSGSGAAGAGLRAGEAAGAGGDGR